jgi:hypothetical protein
MPRWLTRLLGKEKSHEQWLEENPGKYSTQAPPPGISEAESARMRSQMEGELDAARDKRDAE